MTEILMSMQKPYTDLIISGTKTSELRLRAPAEIPSYKVVVYESKTNGGCGKVLFEFVCYREFLHAASNRLDPGLLTRAAVPYSYLRKYTRYFTQSFTEMFIGDLVVYDTPRELSEYGVKRAPMSWQYLRRKTDAN